MKEFFGYGRTRSGCDKGDVVKRHFNDYVNCIHTMVGGGWKTMEVLVAEFDMSEIKYIGQMSSSQNSRVIDPEGISYAVTNGHKDGEPKIIEPIGCAMRGRNPENPSERGRSNGKYKQRIEMGSNISNTITSVQKDSLVAEPNVLTPKRTDFGKQVRKQYESGELDMSRHDMTELKPRQDGVSNTLTSVQKDNLIAEPISSSCIQVGNIYPDSVTTRIDANKHQFLKEMKENKQSNQIITVGYINDGKHQQDFVQHEDGVSRAICCGTHGSGPHLTKTLVSEPLRIPQATKQGYVEIQPGSLFDASYPDSKTRRGRVQDGGQISHTLMASGEGPCYYEGEAESQYRIRKLTPKECFRLMGVSEGDIEKIQNSGVSQSQQYKMAGNSIVVDVLEHIFRKLFVDTGQESQQLLLF